MRGKKIYILLTDTGSILTRLIKFYTKQPYNHASIAFDRNLNEVYSFGRKSVHNPFIGGFVQENIHSVLFSKADCAIYSLSITNENYQKMYAFIQDIASSQDKYRYNFIGLFGVLFNCPIKRKNAFFCSQFVATVLKESNVMNSDTDTALIQPSDLPILSSFELIYEGRLEDYLEFEDGKKVKLGMGL